jgi:hypothetical protein
MATIDSNLIFENYKRIYLNDKIFNTLYENDIKAIENLLIEAGFLKNLGQNLGNKFQNLRQTAQNIYSTGSNLVNNVKQGYNAGANAGGGNNEVANIIKTIVSNIFKTKEDFIKGIPMIASGKVDQEAIETLKSALSQPSQKNESNKEFLARTIFTENNIKTALLSNSLLISEMMNVGGSRAADKSNDVSQELDKLAQEMADKIQKLYPDKQAMMDSIPVFNNKVSQYLGSASQPPPIPPAAASPMGAATGSPSMPQGDTQPAAGADQQGLLQKIGEFAKNHPKMSIGSGVAALGILAAGVSTVGVAGLVTGAIFSALKGAGYGVIIEVAKQMIKNKSLNLKQLDLKQLKSRAGLGALFGGLGGILSTGLGAIGSTLSSIVKGAHSDNESHAMMQAHGANSPVQPNANPNNVQQLHSPNSPIEPNGGGGSHRPRFGNPMLDKYANGIPHLNYVKDVARTLHMNPSDFQLRQGIPYDHSGRRLPIDDDTLDKLAAKHHQTISTKSAIAAADAWNKAHPVKKGGILDF